MPLSEQEQRALEALEQGLNEQDPGFADRVGASTNPRLRLAISVFGLVLGLVLMFLFCVTTVVVVGVAAYLAMFAALYVIWITTSPLLRARLNDRSERPVRSRRPWRRGRPTGL